jgi:hypothetical protein
MQVKERSTVISFCDHRSLPLFVEPFGATALTARFTHRPGERCQVASTPLLHVKY